eukprot:564921-Pleurochrysis_carterae.AAC.1
MLNRANAAARAANKEKAAAVSELEAQVQRLNEELNVENKRLRDEITELKGITEPDKEYFHRDGSTLAVDLAIAKAITTAHVSRNQ